MGDESRSDITSAEERMKARLPRAARRALAVLAQDLEPGEDVLRMALGLLQGSVVQQNGLLVLTARRILFIHSGFVQSQQISVPLDTVTAVTVSKGPLHSTVKTTGPQSNVVVGRVDKTDAEDFAAELRSILANRAHGMTQPQNHPVGGVAEELERLAALRDRGILTDVEFMTQKSKLLGT
jgi:hypothetical protein